ncbi:MAG: hypothetical protein JSW15_10190 [Deltaproteobacteria bacterium]|nr:MAG: hypothetical protein JSW15_10190 [Deltaproteobacteria bacterium]
MEKIASIIMRDGYLRARDATADPRLEQHQAKKAGGDLKFPLALERPL